MIFAGYAGTGKSICASKRTDVLDLHLVPYKYNLPEVKEGTYQVMEALKATDHDSFNVDYPIKYVNAIEENIPKYKHILIPTDIYVLDELDKRGISYFNVLPNLLDESMKLVYEERYRARGNNEQFIDIFIGQWEHRIASLMLRFKPFIFLDENIYMSDVVKGYDEGRLVQQF